MTIMRYVTPSLRRSIVEGRTQAWVYKNERADYIIRVALSCPPWVCRAELRAFEHEARWKTQSTGIKHVVDHVVPVTHPLVCGLTVPWNLQVITYAANAKKSNGLHHAFQVELFDQPEQLSIL